MSVVIHSKEITSSKAGKVCTPYHVEWYYHGNVYFRKNRRTFTNKFFTWTGATLHFLGFRFTKSIRTS